VPDTPASGSGGSKNSLGFLARKIGPVPIWLIGVALVAAWYWYEHYGPGASTNSQSASADQVDPETGESYASELAAAQQQISDLQSAQAPGSATGSSSPVQYATEAQVQQADKTAVSAADNAEKQAAINRSQTRSIRQLRGKTTNKPAPKKAAPAKPETKPATGKPATKPAAKPAAVTRRPARASTAAGSPASATSRWRAK
jgi:hypothetical protein